MVNQLNNIENVKLKRKKPSAATPLEIKPSRNTEGVPHAKSVSELVDKYQGKCFNSRNQSLGKLIQTTDRIQENNQNQIRLLHKILDRVELDRPYLIKDKIQMVAS